MSQEMDLREARPRRPIGSLLLAAVWFVLGFGLMGGAVLHLQKLLSIEPAAWYPKEWIRTSHLLLVGVTGVVGAIGLLSGRRWGWWAAIVACYVCFATFGVVALLNRGLRDAGVGGMVWISVVVALWMYLHRRNVLDYFAVGPAIPWRAHLALFLVIQVAIVAMGV